MLSVNLKNNALGVLPISDSIVNLVLAANTAKQVLRQNMPVGATHVVVNASVNGLYVRANATAAVPAADVLDGTGSAIDPVVIELSNITSLSFINAAVCIVSLSFYKNA